MAEIGSSQRGPSRGTDVREYSGAAGAGYWRRVVARPRGSLTGPDPLPLKDAVAVEGTRMFPRVAHGGRVLAGGGCCGGAEVG